MEKRLAYELGLLLSYNPEGLSASAKSEALELPPLSFYDKHLVKDLALKRLIITPSLRTHLSRSVELKIKNIHDQKTTLPPVQFDSLFPTLKSCKQDRQRGPAIDARSVAQDYQATAGSFGATIASVLSLHTNSPSWSPVLQWARNGKTVDRELYILEEAFAPELNLGSFLDKDVWDSMDGDLQQDLREVGKRFPRLATWQILCANQEAGGALKAMDSLGMSEVFPFRKPLTKGYPATDAIVPCSVDASTTSWGDTVDSFTAETKPNKRLRRQPVTEYALRRSTRLAKKQNTKESDGTKRIPPKRGHKNNSPLKSDAVQKRAEVSLPSLDDLSQDRSCASLPASLIQHGWVRAVESDSTFIVFHNGNFERIGFRHRATGTLFLSDLIDVTKCSNPTYGKMHIGLFIAIIEDALARTRRKLEQEGQPKTKSRKRRLSASEVPSPSKRPRTRAHGLKEATRQLEQGDSFQRVASRDLALVQIQDGILQSPAPSAFLRVGCSPKNKTTYSVDEYMVITIKSTIATGATGAAHVATLELLASDGKNINVSNLVIKLAFDVNQRKRMRHEFDIYQHLISSEVKGIPTIFGLFQDLETRALALLMSNVGTCIMDRHGSPKPQNNFNITQPQREAFIEVVKNIHCAGVRHRDIRPENMVINDEDNTVAIIDFDRAELEASEGSRERELQHLLDLLNGRYYPPGEKPSLRTLPRSQTPLESSSEGSP